MNPALLERPRYLGRRLVQKAGGMLRRCGLGRLLDLLAVERDPYAAWIAHHGPSRFDLAQMRSHCARLQPAPRFSVCMPVADPPLEYLRAAVESVQTQVYQNWELCIAADGCRDTGVLAYLNSLVDDPRMHVTMRGSRGGIAAATNDALASATGEFAAFLDHDDVLAPHALYRFALAAGADVTAGMLYSDEDKLDGRTGRRFDPYFKPGWSPETLLSKMYVGHLLAVRRDLIVAAGGMRSAFDGSQDYDLVLRVSELTDRIVHIPDVLYHWRAHGGSTADPDVAKPYANQAARRALEETLLRRGHDGRVAPVPAHAGRFTVRYARTAEHRVTIVIPTRDKARVLARALASIFARSTYRHFEVLVIDNGSVESSTFRLFARWRSAEPNRFRVVRDDQPFNYSALNNAAVRQAHSPYVILLNNDTRVVTPDWIEAMLEYAQHDGIGAVGALLLYPDGRVQHAGVVIGIGGLAGHIFKRFRPAARTYFDALTTVTNYSAVTAACLMVKRETYEAVGGLDEDLPVAWNDVDFCLKLTAAGFRNVYLPHVRLIHDESVTRGTSLSAHESSRNQREIAMLRCKWAIGPGSDPYYNPWLTLEREDASIAP